jgi:ElaB/YqjD/DUF883 family membrane-anchored ribosome-binding protein
METVMKSRTVPAAANGESRPSAVTLEVQNLVADIEHLLKSATGFSAEDLAPLKAQLQTRAAAVRQSIQSAAGTAVAGTLKTAAAADDYVHAQPWRAVGIGAAAGFLIGALVSGRRV